MALESPPPPFPYTQQHWHKSLSSLSRLPFHTWGGQPASLRCLWDSPHILRDANWRCCADINRAVWTLLSVIIFLWPCDEFWKCLFIIGFDGDVEGESRKEDMQQQAQLVVDKPFPSQESWNRLHEVSERFCLLSCESFPTNRWPRAYSWKREQGVLGKLEVGPANSWIASPDEHCGSVPGGNVQLCFVFRT